MFICDEDLFCSSWIVIKLLFLNDIGLNRNVSYEDYEAFQDCFKERAGSSDELSEDEEPVATQDESLISVASVIREFPRPEELPDIEIFDDIGDQGLIIEIEQEGNDGEIITENDAGQEVIVSDFDDNPMVGTVRDSEYDGVII